MIPIIPSIIAQDQEELDKLIDKIKEYVDTIQIDVMDGEFVENKSNYFDFKLPEGKMFEAHLMVDDPDSWIEKHGNKFDMVIFHVESDCDPKKIIELVKLKGKKVGIAINPETPIDEIKPYLDDVQQVLVMTVEPGNYGAIFLEETLEKVKQLRELKTNLNIEVDGGITPDNIAAAALAGANLFISGSYFVKADDPEHAINKLIRNIQS